MRWCGRAETWSSAATPRDAQHRQGEKLEGGQGSDPGHRANGEVLGQTTLPVRVSDLDGNDEADISRGRPRRQHEARRVLAGVLEERGGRRRGPHLRGPQAWRRGAGPEADLRADGRWKVRGIPGQRRLCRRRGLRREAGPDFRLRIDNKHGTPPRQRNYPVQVAFVRAYDPGGKQVWAAYGWKGQDVADLELMADTRGYRLAMGRDGKLYLGGESAGGNTIWMRCSLDLKKAVNQVEGDQFQHAYNTSANHILAVVRLDPKTGASEMATLLLARIASKGNKGNTLRMRAIAADEQGNVYVGGALASSPPKSPGSFGREGGGAYLVAFDKNFRRTLRPPWPATAD